MTPLLVYQLTQEHRSADGRVQAGVGATTVTGVAEVGILLGAFPMVWGGATLLIDSWIRRDRCERLRPYHASVADQAQEWLQKQ
jgi:hypothetical protein